ncbi:hypothetical protein GZH82_08185 [Staphylococcus ursi]|uniref:hypothetical protein n=1 Tax=Staphylococcus sp. MI 10-1553 TaxID=1912064 RepID=UPI0013972B1F|nr:hypothetical protein [Staphylococcus sp. MI 10-1553]QHW37317.1 hypothetical protein GZH82_08185 [Staphylococcus sp. MI 10-1553]
MKTFSENRLSFIIVIVAVIIGYGLQYAFNLPLIAGAFIGVLLGVLGGFITQLIKSKRERHNSNNSQ